MSYKGKKYISPVGTDFTDYVNTKEDFEKFQELCEAEKKTQGVPLSKCVDDVIKSINLGRDLKGIKARAMKQGNIRDN